ncbi:mechanosensitive ion channel family protein [Rubrivirga sp. S365]|uniref:Mechanosensitive ion channel family protein n=1 Tax=Rubrivirga litoralis TaxID=3075598 RepID=A0ABU3BN65_9BACT|nr:MULTISPECIES: mechanosensitive ion channel family protein [unclassified Rubrivirga]MDT0630721.1 mechanosensitive ion channel family protein [Rubrivirga sp. F394]MDT7856391.1 mechanosensitive ion channel family protein [Rubrivirga sp. S365]
MPLQTAPPAGDAGTAPAAAPPASSGSAVLDALQGRGGAATDGAGPSGAVEAPVRTGSTLGDRVVGGMADLLNVSPQTALNLIETVAVVVVLWGLRALVLAAVRRRSPDDARRLYSWRKGTTYVVVALTALVLLNVWLEGLGSLGTFLGLLTAGIAIALRDPLVNLAGWAFILWRRPFSPGDRVTVHQHSGDVIDQRLFQFTLLQTGTVAGAGQSTGRIVHVPNGWVFTHPVVNHTGAFAYVWHEVPVVVTFESDWRAAKAALLDIAHTVTNSLSPDAERTLRRAARDYFIFYSKLTPTVYTSVVGEGVQLTIRFLVEPRRVRGSEQDVWEAILDRFAARDDIDLAYPTTRMFFNQTEGKPGAGGPPRHGADGAPGDVGLPAPPAAGRAAPGGAGDVL